MAAEWGIHMIKAIKLELFRMTHSVTLIVVFIVLLVANIFINGSEIPGVFNYCDVNTPYYRLYNEATFVTEFSPDRSFSKTLDDVKHVLNLENSQAESLEELYPETSTAQYVRIMWFFGGCVLLFLLIPTMFIRRDLSCGMPELASRLSLSSKNVAIGKICVYYIMVAVISLANSLILMAMYAPYTASVCSFGYVLRCIIQRIFVDMMVMSVPLFISFAVKNVALSTVINLVLGVVYYIVNVQAAKCTSAILVPFPPFLQGQRSIWQPGASAGVIIAVFAVSVCYVLLFSWLSVRSFVKRNSLSTVNGK